MAITTFDSTVAARTRAAALILGTPDLLTAYEAKGGLASDLQTIYDTGHNAEVLSLAQSAAQAAGSAATFVVLADFVKLQKEYNAVMGVVQAVRHDLVLAQAPGEVIKAVDQILVNEAEVTIKTALGDDGKPVVDKDGKAKKVAVKSLSQEALRAEIAKDARALGQLTPAHAALSARKVDKPRLDKLLADAEALSGKLATRTATKAERKVATAAVHDAVEAQKKQWGACYRILRALGTDEPRVKALLGEAARKRSTGKK